MEVQKDFGKRMTALAEGVPREVLANLLARLMPREAVRTRAPERAPMLRDYQQQPTTEAQPRGFAPTKEVKRRLPKRLVMLKTIEITSKGHAKLRGLPTGDQLHTIANMEGYTVRTTLRKHSELS
jgi:hypothetical protein